MRCVQYILKFPAASFVSFVQHRAVLLRKKSRSKSARERVIFTIKSRNKRSLFTLSRPSFRAPIFQHPNSAKFTFSHLNSVSRGACTLPSQTFLIKAPRYQTSRPIYLACCLPKGEARDHEHDIGIPYLRWRVHDECFLLAWFPATSRYTPAIGGSREVAGPPRTICNFPLGMFQEPRDILYLCPMLPTAVAEKCDDATR